MPRPIQAVVHLDALQHNLKIAKAAAPNAEVYAVVKANAYGHSAEIVAPVLEKQGVFGFAVSNLCEAIEIRNMGIEKPILILGYTPVNLVFTGVFFYSTCGKVCG